MPICPICDDTGLMNSDPVTPQFCYCAAGKQAKRQWETGSSGSAGSQRGKQLPQPASFIDVAQLDQVNASVDAMRASLLGGTGPETTQSTNTKNASVQLLYRIAHPGHEISMVEAAQVRELAKTLESFLSDLASIGRKKV
ncbi:MAG: hypothetical protein NVS2B12_19380 [Ktedonobacteraceae bacterium]